MNKNELGDDDRIIDKAIKEDISEIAKQMQQMQKIQRRTAVPVAVFSELRD